MKRIIIELLPLTTIVSFVIGVGILIYGNYVLGIFLLISSFIQWSIFLKNEGKLK